MPVSERSIARVLESVPTSDGAGVRLRRSLGGRPGSQADPFLMLDEFYSDDPRDYLAGFPDHPHRGFETVTIMLEGRMRHRDHMGNTGDLGPGDVQWMTAGRGVIHSEMPQQESGRMRGFQLWINLPSGEKMQPANYRDIPAERIPGAELASGGRVRVIAGRADIDGQSVAGAVNADGDASTNPRLLDAALDAGGSLSLAVDADDSVVVYAADGGIFVGDDEIPPHAAAVLGPGERLHLSAGRDGGRALLLAGRPIREPVVQYGPFVMNTREEIEQALEDYRSGRLAAPTA
ncbi:MAG: pirin family protein [Wenzhouxiangellaceae bacterium]|nr:pirin family protein [Wenzhouxiangellaceae bacterium]